MFRRLMPMFVSLGLVAAGCAGSASDAPPSPESAAPVEFDKQELTVGAPGDDYEERNRVNLGYWQLNANICETLVNMTPDLQTAPGLASKWELQGENTYRFSLRPGVRFHNGAPLTAEAVRYSMNRVVAKRNALSTFIGPESTKVVDDLTVDITPTQPNVRLPEQLVHTFFSILAPETEPADKPICTGAFQFAEYVPNQQLIVRRYEDYWGEKAKLKQITFRFIPDANTRRLAFESGEIDVMLEVPREQTAELERRGTFQVAKASIGAVTLAQFNVRGQEPYTLLQDPDVRKALAMSWDAKALVDQLWQGNASVVKTVGPPSTLGAAQSLVKGFSPDVRQAESLLEGRGWKKGSDGIREKDGRRLSLSLLAQAGGGQEMVELLQAQAKRSGIEMRLDLAPDGSIYNQRNGAGAFDVDLNTWNHNDASPSRLLALLWWSQSTRASAKFTTGSPEFDRLIEEALTARDAQTSVRKSAEAMHLLVDQEALAAPLAGVFRIHALKKSVSGFQAHASNQHQVWSTVFLTGG